MQTPLPYPFSSFNLTSVLDHTRLLNPKQTSLFSSSATTDSKSMDTHSNCEEEVPHFLFQPAFFGSTSWTTTNHHHHHHSSVIYAKNAPMNSSGNENFATYCSGGRGDKMFLKRASSGGGGGNSFSIDSLLGINNVIRQNGGVASGLKEHHQGRYSCGGAYGPVPPTTVIKHGFNGFNLTHHAMTMPRSEQGQCCNGLKRKKGQANVHGSACHNSGGRTAADVQAKLKQQHNTKTSPAPKPNSNREKLNSTSANRTIGSTVPSETAQDSSQNTLRRAAKAKRVRTIFTPEQLERLEAEFERQQYMVGPERLFLASSLHLTEAQVKVWFQNRRIKWRKQHLELQQHRLAVIRSQQIGIEDDDDESSCSDDEFGSSAAASSTSTVLSLSNNNDNHHHRSVIMMESSVNNNYAPHHKLNAQHEVIRSLPIKNIPN